ncbi:hypothetical protein RhiirA4_473423 [Rhizophagus irregularis]|uniref:Uncharacterized protein n=1 Tax=Rhizophagus irregularis TaxID=588596 RepID=A0A2I1H6Q0_9GLOM|nr:hypothetical protein RhiirA4_473423 [Rhizophagus irregularis]
MALSGFSNHSGLTHSDTQLRLLINERKQKNSKYYATPNKKKQDFWDDISLKAKRYREGTETKKSLVGKKYTKNSQRSSELPFEQVRNENVSRTSSYEISVFSISPERPKEKSSSAIGVSEKSLSLANPVETPNISRPIILTLPSFLQNANVINVTFNYGGAQTEDD